jgi:hypothetical protein
MMTGCIFSRTEEGLKKKLEARGRSMEALRERGMIVATEENVGEQLAQLSEAGVQRVMLQWLELDDLQGLEDLASVVL